MALLKSRQIYEGSEHQLKHALDFLGQMIRRQRIENNKDIINEQNFKGIMIDCVEKLLMRGQGFSNEKVNEY